jgi:HK97 family phage major capsid protein
LTTISRRRRGTNLTAFCGDFRRGYGIILPGAPVLLQDPYTSKGSVLIYSERRVGGALLDSNAIRAIKCGTT